jgi:type III secretory pathway component EscU
MNETLKQIAIKAQVEHCISHVRLQEFAELIVKECARCMTTPKIQAEWPHDVAVKIVIDTLAQDMCEHFGVKE